MIKLLRFWLRSIFKFKEGWRWTELELADGSYFCGFTKGIKSLGSRIKRFETDKTSSVAEKVDAD